MQPRKVTDEIIEALRRDISTGLLPAGARLPSEKELAHEYGVSQPTIREVVRALEVMGLVSVRHGSGAWVLSDGGHLVRTSLETVMQLENVSILQALDVRGVLGRDSARNAALNATDADLANIERAYEDLSGSTALRTLDALIEAIAGFQVAVSQAAHNPLQFTLEHFLIDLLLNLQFKAMRTRGVRFWQARAASFQSDRRAIADAVIARRPEAAEAAMAAYLTHQRDVFTADKDLANLRLSDPKAVLVASDLRLNGRRLGREVG